MDDIFERSGRARMYTYTPRLGDVVKWPNGVEMNYDSVTESVVVLHPNEKAVLTVRPDSLLPHEATPLTDSRVWMIGRTADTEVSQ